MGVPRQFSTAVIATIIGCAGIAMAMTANAATGDWQVIHDSSSVSFTATEQGTEFQGSFADFKAQITFNPDHLDAGHIIGTVKTASVDTGNSTRDSQLPGPGWFASTQYPTAHFESTSMSKASDGGYIAKGKLTMKAITHPATMHFTFKKSDPASAKFSGTMTINRMDYKIGSSVNPNIAGKNVTIKISLDLTR